MSRNGADCLGTGLSAQPLPLEIPRATHEAEQRQQHVRSLQAKWDLSQKKLVGCFSCCYQITCRILGWGLDKVFVVLSAAATGQLLETFPVLVLVYLL